MPTENKSANTSQEASLCELCWLEKGPRHTETKPHTLGPTFPCGTCNRFFSSKGARSRHRKSTSCVSVGGARLHCPICNLDFGVQKGCNATQLRKHFKTHGLEIPPKSEEIPNTKPSVKTMPSSNTTPFPVTAPSTSTSPPTNSIVTPDTVTPDTVPTAAGPIPAPAIDVDPLSVFCRLCWMGFRDIEQHNKSKAHLRGLEVRCSRCVSERWFSSKGARKRHMRANVCSELEENRCCDCDISFASAKLLSLHRKDTKIHPAPAVPEYVDHNGDVEDLSAYLGSVSLDPKPKDEGVPCLGMGCGRSFRKAYAMLTHIESGFCRSKLNRDIIDNIIIEGDPTNIITDRAAVEERARDMASIASSEYSNSINGGVFSSEYSNSINGSVFSVPSDGTITPRARRRSLATNSDDSDDDFQGIPLSSSSAEGYIQCPTPAESEDGALTRTNSGDSDNSYDIITPSDSENGVMLTPSNSSDSDNFSDIDTPSDSEDDVYLTPSNSGYSKTSRVYLTPSESSGSGVFSLSTDSLSSLPNFPPAVIKCPICPPAVKKTFPSIEALHTHLRSKMHQPKIYHCPLPTGPDNDDTAAAVDEETVEQGNGLKKKKKAKKAKNQPLKQFATLSSLGQHVDSGACKKGEVTFDVTVAFVHEKLKEMGRASI